MLSVASLNGGEVIEEVYIEEVALLVAVVQEFIAASWLMVSLREAGMAGHPTGRTQSVGL